MKSVRTKLGNRSVKVDYSVLESVEYSVRVSIWELVYRLPYSLVRWGTRWPIENLAFEDLTE